MAKGKRARRARNKVEGAPPRELTTTPASDPPPLVEPGAQTRRPQAVRIVRSALFTAELEEAIEIIARERVYQAMRARLGLRLLLAARANGDIIDA